MTLEHVKEDCVRKDLFFNPSLRYFREISVLRLSFYIQGGSTFTINDAVRRGILL